MQKGFFSNNSSTSTYSFEIIGRDNNEILVSIPIESGELVEYAYVHSSDGTPVEQTFIVKEDGLLHLLEERYTWYGAGLEFGSGLDVDTSGAMVRITGYERAFAELSFRVAWTVPMKFQIRDIIIRLSDLAPGGTSLLVRITETS